MKLAHEEYLRMRRRLWCAVLLAPLHLGPADDQKTDVVVLKNGDRTTCQIQYLLQGKLNVQTDTMGTLLIQWDDVAEVRSKQVFRIELADGAVHFGSLGKAREPGTLLAVGKDASVSLPLIQVVRMNPVGQSFLDRVGGHVSLGLSYNKGSEVGQLSFSGGLNYQSRENRATLDLDTMITTQQSDVTSKRSELAAGYSQFLGDRWLAGVDVSAEQNDELGLELRTSITPNFGRRLVQTNHELLSLTGGLSVNREVPTGSEPRTTNLDAMVGAEFRLFRYDEPSTDFSVQLRAFPGLTDLGRIRAYFDTRLRKELIDDFFLDLSLYVSYDSDPPSSAASTNDFGFVTSLGYSW